MDFSNKCHVWRLITGVYLEKFETVFLLPTRLLLSFIFCFYIYLFFPPCFVSSSLPFSIMITFCSFHSSFPSSSLPACYQSSSATTRHSSCHILTLVRIHFTPLFHVHTSFHQPCPPSPLLVTVDNNVQWGSSSASWLHAAFCRPRSEYGLLRVENHIYQRCERLFDTMVKREGKPLWL